MDLHCNSTVTQQVPTGRIAEVHLRFENTVQRPVEARAQPVHVDGRQQRGVAARDIIFIR